MAGPLTEVARELARYKLDSVGVQEVRRDKVGTVRAEDHDFFCGKGNENHQLRTEFFVHHQISSLKRVEFVSDRVSYIVLRDCWYNIIVLNVHAPSEDILHVSRIRVNILGVSIHTIKENAEALVVASTEIGLELNAYKTKYMIISRDQNAGRSHSIKNDNSSFPMVEVYKFLEKN
jgi:hypothetical protein